MALTAELLVRLKATQTGSNDFGGPKLTPQVEKQLNFADGTGASQADILFVDERTVASATNDDLDLAGALSDAFGATITAVEICAILIINGPITGSANTTDLTVGNEGTNPFEGFISAAGTIGPIKPGGIVCIGSNDAAGIGTVTAGTGDKLRIANSSGASATYQIAILGRTA